MNWCCSRVWTMWAQRPSGLSTRTSTRRGSTAIGSPWRIWKVSYLFFLNLIHGDRHATYRAISVSVTLRSSSRKEEKKEEEEKSQKFFLLILFTLVKVAAASISDSCPPYVGQFFQRSSPSSILCFVNKRTAWTKGAFHPREIVACFSSAKRGKRGCGSLRRSYPLSD